MALTKKDLQTQYSEQVQELRAQLSDKDRILQTYKKDHGKLEVFFDELRMYLTPLRPLPPRDINKGSGVDSPITAVMQITDAHMGEVQMADEIEGFNEFNPEICKKRQLLFADLVISYITLHRNVYTIDDLVILVTGDLISGDIHDELRITNAFPTPVQCVEAGKVLAEQLYRLARHFKNIRVEFIVEDNHSRLTKKPQAKEAGYNSLNYIVGKLAQIYTERHDNIDFRIHPMYEKIVHVSNRQYLISHGHGIRGWMGIPWYSVQRKIGKESSNRMSLIMEDMTKARKIGFHKFVFGHFHTPFDHPLYSCAPSVSGTNAYDHRDGRFAEPGQSAWLVHPKYGEFGRVNFKLIR